LLGLLALAALAGSPLDARLRGVAAPSWPAVALSAFARSASAGPGPSSKSVVGAEAAQNPEFDLLIKGGRVIDPKNGVNAVMDVAVAGGKVALVAANIANARAREVADTSAVHVTPGLIDIHAHVFWGHDVESQYSDGYSAVQPDAHSFGSGQTTLVDVGGAGWKSFPRFKAQVIDRSQTRVLSFLNIVGSGMRGGPVEQDLSDMDAKLTATRIRQHPGVIVGVKVAHLGLMDHSQFVGS
jgi:dihydroorotase